MRKALGLLGVTLFSLYNYSSAQMPSLYSKSISQEEPADIVREIIERREIAKRDVANIVSLTKDYSQNQNKYSNVNLIEGLVLALEDEVEKDPLFYVWEDYDSDDYILKNQTINAGWKTLVAHYPRFFGKLENTIIGIKNITTLDSGDVKGYRIKMNPELSANDQIRIKIRINAKNRFLDSVQLRVSEKEIEFGKIYSVKQWGKNSNFELSFSSDYKQEYCLKATVKIPFWFEK